jgi:hydrogenase maturation factor HypF (carbamoyltransferase family)
MTTVKCIQLCPKCQNLFSAEKGNPRNNREIVREICCPKCLEDAPGKELSKKFEVKK